MHLFETKKLYYLTNCKVRKMYCLLFVVILRQKPTILQQSERYK